MSSNVRQAFQSCLDPKLGEPLVLRLKLGPSKFNFTEKIDNKKQAFDDSESKNNNNGEMDGWNSIQSLTNTSQIPKNSPEKLDTENKVYVHPLTKRSASMMSNKSLEMCTESLGSESGSSISESMAENLSHFSDNADLSPKSCSSKNLGTSWAATKKTCRRCFPPPLTSISGGDGSFVRVKPHREGGRLVIKAVTVFSSKTVFHAERGNGRLRLHLFKGSSVNSNSKKAINDDDDDDEVEKDVEDDETECDEGIEGDIENVEGKMGIEKFQKLSWCKESGHKKKDLWNLEACLIAST